MEQKKLRHIEIQAKARVLDLFQGMYRSAFKGRGIEFEDLREYVVGDDVRAISWTKLAQTGKPFIKNFREERDLTVMIMVDISGSQSFQGHHGSKREKAADITALLSFSAYVNQDRVGLILFSDRIEKYMAPKKGLKHTMGMVEEVLNLQAAGKKTDLAAAFTFLYQVTKKPVIAFVLSDFQDGDYEKALLIAAKKDDLILIRLYDPEEKELPPLGLARFQDMETAEEMFVDVDSALQQSFREQYERQCQQFRNIVKKCGVSTIELSTEDKEVPLLKAFFEARRRRRW